MLSSFFQSTECSKTAPSTSFEMCPLRLRFSTYSRFWEAESVLPAAPAQAEQPPGLSGGGFIFHFPSRICKGWVVRKIFLHRGVTSALEFEMSVLNSLGRRSRLLCSGNSWGRNKAPYTKKTHQSAVISYLLCFLLPLEKEGHGLRIAGLSVINLKTMFCF